MLFWINKQNKFFERIQIVFATLMQFVGLWKNYLCLFISKASTFWYPQNQIWIRTFQNFSLEKLYCAIIVLFTPVLPVPLNNARQFEVGGCGRNHHAFYWKQRKQNSCISSYLVACTRFRPPSFEREPIHLNLTRPWNSQSAQSAQCNVKHKKIGMKRTNHKTLEATAAHK